jgi:hypothetical protein
MDHRSNIFVGGRYLVAISLAGNASYKLAQRQLDNAKNHQRLSVRPYLFLTRWVNHVGGKGEWTLTLHNTGVGPALIESVQVWVNKLEIIAEGEKLWDEAIEQMFIASEQPVIPDSRYGIGKGFCLGHGQKLDLVKLTLPSSVTEATNRKLKDCRMLIRYKSFYDDPFEFDSDAFPS